MYKLLALDMDGTLLNREKRMTDSVKDALQMFMQNDGLLMIASGRFPASVWLHARAAGMNAPLIALNGAVILNERTGELLHGTAIAPEDASRLAQAAEELGVYLHFYGYNILFVREINEMNAGWPLANVVVSPDKPLTEAMYRDQTRFIQVIPVQDLVSFAASAVQPLFKATVISEEPSLLERFMSELQNWGAFTLTRTGRRRFDINAKGVCKRSALELVAHTSSLLPSQVAAAGDYDNDISMLTWAGLGIAMGNAKNHIKQIADVVTLSNEEDGVAHAIKNYLLEPYSKS